MKYELDQALSEILQRRTELRKKQERKKVRGLAGATAALFVILIAAVQGLAGIIPGNLSESYYGAFRLSQSAGGYVLVGVIAFAAAVAVTLICQRWRYRAGDLPPPEDREERKGGRKEE